MLKDKIVLEAGGASVTICDGLVKSQRLPTAGTTEDVAGVAAQTIGEIIPGQ
ncbi:hypothetical protein RHCH11_RHCH11_00924 [Beijerinckiaceae bacterium RH CH11]|jgi:hypothetical protein|nr:hypothetical protein RHCH11_RHCH11_00924 [Beijerinckiaceae bacterium RH CH11]VVB43898.1 hypothetical protein RHAL8_00921 [Beijerinckiaceae bacterium RH AL8]